MALLLQNGSYLLSQSAGVPAGKLLTRGDPGAVYHAVAPAWRTANFGDGTTNVAWAAPLDPAERKTYTISASTELNAIGDQIQSVQVALSGLAALAGLHIYGVTNDATNVSIWFEIDEIDRSRPAWNPPGEVHLVTITITGTSGHVFERTAALRIRQIGRVA
jgi:hypothetical protein